jgi:hypothetical protein
MIRSAATRASHWSRVSSLGAGGLSPSSVLPAGVSAKTPGAGSSTSPTRRHSSSCFGVTARPLPGHCRRTLPRPAPTGAVDEPYSEHP